MDSPISLFVLFLLAAGAASGETNFTCPAAGGGGGSRGLLVCLPPDYDKDVVSTNKKKHIKVL